jgi:hypothetical protein
MRIYKPKNRYYPSVINITSAWGDIPTIIGDIIDTFDIRNDKCLEFGVEYGFSTSALSNHFRSVIGVDTFEGDEHSGIKNDHLDITTENLKEYQNITLVKSGYKEWITDREEFFDLIHIDIIHDYEHTYECGEWSVQHSPITIFHDTVSFPDVMNACKDLSEKYGLEFWNYPYSNGLGILVNPRLLPMKWTIGWISHNKEAFDNYLLPSLSRASGNFNTIYTDDILNPAKNYNNIIDNCKTRWLILCHEDISFSHDLLERIETSISLWGKKDFVFGGIAGPEKYGKVIKSRKNVSDKILTTDCCFIVIDTNNSVRFDEDTFDDFHLYVEDFCIQSVNNKNGYGSLILCDFLTGNQWRSIDQENKSSWIYHAGYTVSQRGYSWGRYHEYRARLRNKWGEGIQTT